MPRTNRPTRSTPARSAFDSLEPRTLLSTMVINNPGYSYSVPPPLNALHDANGTLLFVNDDGIHGRELWRSDGTQEGTTLLRDINPAGTQPPSATGFAVFPDSGPASLLTVGRTTYFTADDGTHGRELWKTDNTTAGTVLLKDLFPGASPSDPANFLVAGGKLFFTATSATGVTQLWRTDGTTAGTIAVKTINSLSANGIYADALPNEKLAAVGNTVYFINAMSGSAPDELWKTDGTPQGTTRLTVPADLNLKDSTLHTDGNRLYVLDDYTAAWTLDPASSALTRLKDFFGAELEAAGTIGGRFFFRTRTRGPNTSGGSETYTVDLWSTDGTTAGTHRVWRSGTLGSSDVYDLNFTPVVGYLYFSLRTAYGPELWRFDPAGHRSFVASYTPSRLVDAGDALYFEYGNQLVRSDGTPNGTAPVVTLPAPGTADPSSNSGNTYTGSSFSYEGTLTFSWLGDSRQLTPAAGRLFFLATDPVRGVELFAYTPDSPRRKLRPIRTLPVQVALSNGALSIDGSSGNDVIKVTAASGQITVDWNGVPRTYPAANVRTVIIRGLAGNDALTLSGPLPAATLVGGDGNDTLIGGDNADTLYGYDKSPSGVLTSVSTSSGSSSAPPTVTTDNDRLLGGLGDDALYGGPGLDRLTGNLGRDLFSGGDGIDTADYAERHENLTISLDGRARDGAPGERDNVLPDIEIVNAGAGDDHLVGSANDDSLNGGLGNDTLEGGSGNDELIGDDGDDRLYGNAGNDYLNGKAGHDLLDGGSGDDTLSAYNDANARDDLFGGKGHDTAYHDRRDRLTSIEQLLA